MPVDEVRIGVRLPNSGPFAEADALASTSDLAERLGYDRVWVHDHVSWPQEKLTHFATGSLEACQDQDPNFFESLSSAAWLSGHTSNIGVGIAGLVVPLRDPRILAKQLATIDRLSGGRLVVALAIGAIRGDFEVMGVPFERRGKLTNEYLAAVRAILDGDQPVSVSGETVTFTDGTFLPKPQRLGLWVTGSSEPGLKRAARFADGWMTVYQPVDIYRGFVQRLGELTSEQGRTEALVTGYETYVCVADTRDEAISIARRSLEGKFETLEKGLEVCIVGGPDDFVEQVNAYADAGAQHFELKFIAHSVEQLNEMMARVAEAAELAVPAA
ncbi:MAG TPA: LLM class flavin-dependent oxidoreductase [Candidatus Limnocylindria bacterium]|nr:LLM class flavin-dependent oxidoreductase [Candidatus Limnocylindria bacterium]